MVTLKNISFLSIPGEGSLVCCSPQRFLYFPPVVVGYLSLLWGFKDRGCTLCKAP